MIMDICFKKFNEIVLIAALLATSLAAFQIPGLAFPQPSCSPGVKSTTNTASLHLCHPILGTLDYHGFESKPIDASVYKLLNSSGANLFKFQLPFGELGDREANGSFDLAEFEVMTKFSDLARGKTKQAMLKLAGEPTAKMGKIDCWSDSKDGEENWLYCFGFTENLLVRIVFNKDLCSQAMIRADSSHCQRNSYDLVYEAEPDYNKWRSKQIKDYCLGKTLSEIKEIMGDQRPALIKGDEIIEYAVSKRTLVELKMKDGKCISAETIFLTHRSRAGLRRGQVGSVSNH